MQKHYFYSLLLCLITSCIVDYDIKTTDIDEPNRLVVNSFLNPQKPINVYFLRLTGLKQVSCTVRLQTCMSG